MASQINKILIQGTLSMYNITNLPENICHERQADKP